ncbi:hypothetical protein [Nitrosarchaeum sp. AC2]|uniref:hypothetical protein n=1 Tax=Nitrosarchaeum sp. AC2 TaxID=2259673 RepID=UPI0015CCDB1F|nr:hypothetical protein [Nitrosarchaeum sp. AC2]QLH11262.1 hypothetical protein DSQ20_07160 [Nitrosarchaeum sp. AC2]
MSKELEDISKKLDTVTRLLAFDLIKDKSVNEQIEILTKAGLKVGDMAVILDKTENQIYVTQTTLRKKKKKESVKQSTEPVEGQNV